MLYDFLPNIQFTYLQIEIPHVFFFIEIKLIMHRIYKTNL